MSGAWIVVVEGEALGAGVFARHFDHTAELAFRVEAQEEFCKVVFQIFLYGSLQRACAEVLVVALLCNEFLSLFGKLQFVAELNPTPEVPKSLSWRLPTLEVMMMMVFLKSMRRPSESVSRPSSIT